MIESHSKSARRIKPVTSLLGLALDGSRLEAVWLKRSNGALQVVGRCAVTLTLDPLTAAPELVGREIRNHLDAAEIRERRCVVGLPLKWALMTPVTVPPLLADADAASFLELEAERGFPCDVSTLIMAASRSVISDTETHATLIGMPRGHLEALTAALRAAGLKVESLTLGLAALQPPTAPPMLTVLIGEGQVGLQLTQGGGILSLRSVEGGVETTGGRSELQLDVVAREIRITLGQLPPGVRAKLQSVRLFGPLEMARSLAAEIQRRWSELKVEVVERASVLAVEAGLPADTPVSVALSAAVRRMTGAANALEFLPPRVSSWQQWTSRFGTGKLRRAGLIGGGVVVVVVLAFLGQQFFLWRLESQWAGMKAEVEQLEAVQARLKKYRPWYDESARTLSILRAVTQAFPEDGMVTAKTLEMRDQNRVTCTGIAKDYASLLKVQEKLNTSGLVADLKLNRIQGKAPTMQFTFDFRWVEGGASAN